MKLCDLMKPDPVVITQDCTLREAASMMKDNEIGILPVVEGSKGKANKNKILGMLTDRDITIRSTAQGNDPNTIKVQDVYTKNLICGYEQDQAKTAFNTMIKNEVGRLLVLNSNKQLAGIVTMADIIESDPEEACDILSTMKQMEPA